MAKTEIENKSMDQAPENKDAAPEAAPKAVPTKKRKASSSDEPQEMIFIDTGKFYLGNGAQLSGSKGDLCMLNKEDAAKAIAAKIMKKLKA